MNKLEIGGVVATLTAIVSVTVYINGIQKDVERLEELTANFDEKSLQTWKEDIEVKVQKADLLPIGTLVSTILEPHDFMAIVDDRDGNSWVVADGRLVNNSQFHKITGNPRVPDLRAMFLRGKNKFDETSGNRSDRFSEVGQREDLFGYSYQEWSTALPRQSFVISNADSHNHGAGSLSGTTNSAGNHSHTYNDHAFGHDLNDRGEPNKSEDNDGFDIRRATQPSGNHSHSVTISAGSTSESGIHSHYIQNGGDLESRPNNVSVYFMIRIN